MIKEISVSEIVESWQQAYDIHWQAPRALSTIQYWQDEESGLKFYTPVEAAGGPALYSQLEELPGYYKPEKWEFSQSLSILRRHQGIQKILEVGAGRGYFLRRLLNSGYEAKGLEFNESAIEFARERGLEVVPERLDSLCGVQPGSWDAICSFQVLEHVSEPEEFLRQCVQLLRDGGLLLLSVPNADVLGGIDPDRVDLLDQPPHHMSHWNPRAFAYLTTLFPLRQISIHYEPLDPDHIRWFVDAWSLNLYRRYGKDVARLLLGRYTKKPLRFALRSGMRHLVRGHSLLAVFQKVDPSSPSPAAG